MPLIDVCKNRNQLNIFDKEWLGMSLDENHELYKLKKIIDYNFLEKLVSKYYKISEKGRPKHEGLVLCCMLIIQSIYKWSDERAAKMFSENPYYQNLCGFQYFQKEYKISSFAILRFRQSLGESGISELLAYTIKIAIDTELIKKKTLKM